MLFVFLTDWAAEMVGDVIDISIKVSNRQSTAAAEPYPLAMTAVLLSA
jgi:hypothetical protein